jgi:hypothetical protein
MSPLHELSWVSVPDAPFHPYFDLVAGDTVLASLFYDDKPEVAHASVPVVHDDGTVEWVSGAEAGLDEDEVGWCLQWADEGKFVRVVSSLDASSGDALKEIARAWADERRERLGGWDPAPGWRLWNAPHLDQQNGDPGDP